jgi:hypothetical protein
MQSQPDMPDEAWPVDFVGVALQNTGSLVAGII